MRKSKIIPKMRNGEVVSSILLHSNDHRLVEVACMSGFDCIWVCSEHTANDWHAIETNILAAKAHDTDIVIRTSRGSYNDLIKPLELDATGIMVPHCMDYEDAKQICKITRFSPRGLRPVGCIGADSNYLTMDIFDYVEQSEKEKLIIVQIEDKEAIPDLERICEIDGIDMIFFGPGDFSQSVGKFTQYDDEDIQDVYKRIPMLAAKYGKFAGTVSGSEEDTKKLIDMGYNFINIAVDIRGLNLYYKDCLQKFSEIAKG